MFTKEKFKQQTDLTFAISDLKLVINHAHALKENAWFTKYSKFQHLRTRMRNDVISRRTRSLTFQGRLLTPPTNT